MMYSEFVERTEFTPTIEEAESYDGRRDNNMIPNIKINKAWTAQTVRETCKKFNLYTCGDNADYDKVLNMVANSKPTVENIYAVAKDITVHNNSRDVEDVMFFIGNNAIITTYLIEE